MDKFDLQVAEVVRVLAAIVNRAGRAKETSAAAVKMSEVPTQLLYQARKALEPFVGSEFQTQELKQARDRTLS